MKTNRVYPKLVKLKYKDEKRKKIDKSSIIFWDKGSINTHFGELKENFIQKGKSKTEKDHEVIIYDRLAKDLFRGFRRGPAIVLDKDAGLIIAKTSLQSGWRVLDAGAGTGFLTTSISLIVGKEGKVYSYENRKEFYDTVKENLNFMQINGVDVSNIELKNKDVFKKIDEKELDLITLDMTEPWKAFKNCYKALKDSHYMVCYVPNTTQMMEIIKEVELLKKKKIFFEIESIEELIERKWIFRENVLRPDNKGLMHTAFLMFLRKFK